VIAGQPLLQDTSAITGNNPTGAVRIILHGQFPPPEQRGPWMPAFATTLSDAQIAEVLNFLRQTAHQAPWPDLAQRAQAMRAKPTEAQ
jgi:mono/diheme cytochrome c family protein